jgi:hypothetical protein
LVTIPDKIRTEFRRALFSDGENGFISLFEQINKNFSKIIKKNAGSVPSLEIAQRRYRTQRSAPIYDSRLSFDLRTAFKGSKAPKYQPAWFKAAYESISKKRANTQLAIGIRFAYADCKTLNNPKILDAIADSWIACKPLIKATVG